MVQQKNIYIYYTTGENTPIWLVNYCPLFLNIMPPKQQCTAMTSYSLHCESLAKFLSKNVEYQFIIGTNPNPNPSGIIKKLFGLASHPLWKILGYKNI